MESELAYAKAEHRDYRRAAYPKRNTSRRRPPTEAEHETPDGHGRARVAVAMNGGKRPPKEVGVLNVDNPKN